MAALQHPSLGGSGSAPCGQLIVVGAAEDPLQLPATSLIIPAASIDGHPSGTSKDSEDTLNVTAAPFIKHRMAHCSDCWPAGATTLDSSHTGLDHVSFAVAGRADLDDAAAALTDAGIEHGEVIELADAGIAILSFQDPDDINIELTAPLP